MAHPASAGPGSRQRPPRAPKRVSALRVTIPCAGSDGRHDRHADVRHYVGHDDGGVLLLLLFFFFFFFLTLMMMVAVAVAAAAAAAAPRTANRGYSDADIVNIRRHQPGAFLSSSIDCVCTGGALRTFIKALKRIANDAFEQGDLFVGQVAKLVLAAPF